MNLCIVLVWVLPKGAGNGYFEILLNPEKPLREREATGPLHCPDKVASGSPNLVLPRNLFPNTAGWGLRHPLRPTLPSISLLPPSKSCRVLTPLPVRDEDQEEPGAVLLWAWLQNRMG